MIIYSFKAKNSNFFSREFSAELPPFLYYNFFSPHFSFFDSYRRRYAARNTLCFHCTVYNSQKEENKKVSSDNINPDPYKTTGSGSKIQKFTDKRN
jgi:hypothetical protein